MGVKEFGLRQRHHSLLAAILVIAAIFMICNCAIYLIFTVADPSLFPAKREIAGLTNSSVATSARVVAFVTPTPTPFPIATLSSGATVPTPAPLLPTVTPGPSPTTVPP